MKKNYGKFFFTLFTFFFFSPILTFSQNMDVPAKIQVQIILKSLSYDRNFKEKPIFGIVYTEKSEKIKNEIVEELDKVEIKNISINLGKEKLGEIVSEEKVNVIYACPEISDLKEIIKVSQSKKILTTTGIEKYVEKGISLGIIEKEKKPKIIVNIPSLKKEERNFEASFLKLTEIKVKKE